MQRRHMSSRKRILSARELEQVQAYRERFAASARSTEPAQRSRAAAALRQLYAQAGLAEPELVWADSPAALVRAAASHPQAGRGVWQALGAAAVDPSWLSIWEELEAGDAARVWREMKGSSWLAFENIEGAYGDPTATGLPAEFPPEPERGQRVQHPLDEGAELVGLWQCYSADVSHWWPSGGRFTSNSRWIGDLLPGFAFHHEELALAGTETVAPLLELAETAGLWIAKERKAFLCERPVRFCLDEQGRLHSGEGPALAWRDGGAIYAWHGIRVSARAIEAPETLSAREIVREPNAEVRRVMLERIGYERFFAMQKMKLVSKDEAGKLWRLELKGDIEEPLVLVEVENATVEPDGTRKRYLLRVPPYMRTARDAVAWTFGFDRDEYQLIAAS